MYIASDPLESKGMSEFGNIAELTECYANLIAYLFEKYNQKTIDQYEKKDLITLAYYQGVMGRIDQMAALVSHILGFKNGISDLKTYDLNEREFSLCKPNFSVKPTLQSPVELHVGILRYVRWSEQLTTFLDSKKSL